MNIKERKQELLRDAAYYRGLTFTLTKMTQYYGQRYSDALAKFCAAFSDSTVRISSYGQKKTGYVFCTWMQWR